LSKPQKAVAKETSQGQVIHDVELKTCDTSEVLQVEQKWPGCISSNFPLAGVKERISEEHLYPSMGCSTSGTFSQS
jgi:hypothetical protein